MPSSLFFALFLSYLGICIVCGCILGYKKRRKYETQSFESCAKHVPLFIDTEPRGCGGSRNSDITFEEAIKNQGFALKATLKFIC